MVAGKKTESGCTYYQYPVHNHHGDVIRVTDDNGTVMDSYEYNAWGVPLCETETGATNRFRWQANWLKLKEGLSKSPARLYLDNIGRFLQREKGGSLVGSNLYAQDRPTTLVDPLGLKAYEGQVMSPRASVGSVGTAELFARVVLSLVQEGTIELPTLPWILDDMKDLLVKNPDAFVLAALGYRFSPGAAGAGTNAFVYTCRYGWIDLGHFFLSATISYFIGHLAAYSLSWILELLQEANFPPFGEGWQKSGFSAEDLLSNWTGSRFGERVRQDSLAARIGKHLKVALLWAAFLIEAGAVAHRGQITIPGNKTLSVEQFLKTLVRNRHWLHKARSLQQALALNRSSLEYKW